MITDELSTCWATPITTRTVDEVEDFNFDLEKAILELKEIDPGVNLTTFIGWHSSGNLFQKSNQLFDNLKELLVHFISDYIAAIINERSEVLFELFAWVNVLERGGYHMTHTHAGHLSGIYYVNPGEPDPNNLNSGQIVFSDPRCGANRISSAYLDFGSSYQYAPKAGMMVLFPAYLPHWVHPFTGAGRRIAVSFNVKLIDPAQKVETGLNSISC